MTGDRITRDSDGRKGTLVPAASTAPLDCTNRCDTGPCDCSGEWRVVAWAIKWDDTAEGGQ